MPLQDLRKQKMELEKQHSDEVFCILPIDEIEVLKYFEFPNSISLEEIFKNAKENIYLEKYISKNSALHEFKLVSLSDDDASGSPSLGYTDGGVIRRVMFKGI